MLLQALHDPLGAAVDGAVGVVFDLLFRWFVGMGKTIEPGITRCREPRGCAISYAKLLNVACAAASEAAAQYGLLVDGTLIELRHRSCEDQDRYDRRQRPHHQRRLSAGGLDT